MAAGDDSSVAITAGTGTPVDTRLTANGDHRQVMALGNAGDVVAAMTPWGSLETNTGTRTLFYDEWGINPIDTTDKWTVTGSTPGVALGVMTMSATVSTYHAIRSKDTVRPNLGYTYVANGITLETSAAVGAGRFWGLGTTATTPSATSLAQDGIGFEVDQATGALLAVTYAAGVRTTVATLPAGSAPTGTGANSAATVPNYRDAGNHRYALYFRVTQAYWFVDNLQIPVASASFPNVQVAGLPALIVRNNAASFTGTPVFTSIAHATGDTEPSASVIKDPVVGARQARVTSGGALSASVAQSPASGLAPNAQTVGTTASTVASTNLQRTALWLVNAGPTTIYLRWDGGTASTSLYTWRLDPGDRYDMLDRVPVGLVSAISSAASGSLMVTEAI